MPNLLERLTVATKSAYQEFISAFADPRGATVDARADAASQSSRNRHYSYWWSWYNNTLFDDPDLWGTIASEQQLYQFTRPLINPTRRVVDFYANTIYAGAWTTDGAALQDGSPLAIPLDGASDALQAAIGQVWRQSSWASSHKLWIRYASALGDGPVELVENRQRRRVEMLVRWPGDFKSVTIDSGQHVQEYVIEYPARYDGKAAMYRKEVDKERIATYRDGDLFDWSGGGEAEYANPYGFCPLIWAKHTDLGGATGAPALKSPSKVVALNELLSAVADRLIAASNSPLVISGTPATTAPMRINNPVVQQAEELRAPRRSEMRTIKTADGTGASALDIPAADVAEIANRLMDEIHADNPELTAFQKLREMSNVTGPAVRALLGDVTNLVEEARANYDLQSVKLFQMNIAMSGMHANDGSWGALDALREVFRPFNLDSFQAGALDFDIGQRDVFSVPRRSVQELMAYINAANSGYISARTVTAQFVDDPDAELGIIQAATPAVASLGEVEALIDGRSVPTG